MQRARCQTCGMTAAEGKHRLSPEESQTFPHGFCPKCSGGPDDGWPICVSGGVGYYRCSCGVTWTERLAEDVGGSTPR